MAAQSSETLTTGKTSPMARVLDTPVAVAPGFFFNLFTIWTGMTWIMARKHPNWDRFSQLLSGVLSGTALVIADVGHAFAHTLSARAAGAPVDQVRLSSGMPRTLYHDQAVSPRTHILRALGGPLFSLLGFVFSLVVRALLPRGGIPRAVAGWSSVGHGLILTGSLAPLPIVDGGSILKWSLVESGKSSGQADQVVQQAGVATGIGAAAAGAAFAARRKWLPAAGLLAAGIVAIAAARGKIR